MENFVARSFFFVAFSLEKRSGEAGLGRRLILRVLTRFSILFVLRYRSFFDNPIKPFDGDNWKTIFGKSGGKVVKIFEKSFFLVVKFDNFG